jgi:PAS domain S-box-containing protein
MRFRNRIFAGFGGVIVLFSIFIIAIFIFLSQTSERVRHIVDEQFVVESIMQESLLILSNIQTQILDVLFLEPGRKNDVKILLDGNARKFYKNIDFAADAMPSQDESFNKIRTNFRMYYQYASSILGMNNEYEVRTNRDVLDKFRENKTLLGSLIDTTAANGKKEFERSLNSLNSSFITARFIAGISIVVLILFSVTAAFIISGRLTRPVEQLTSVAERIAQGDFEAKYTSYASGEMKTLSSAFNTMMDALNAAFSELHNEIGERKKAEEELRKARNYLNNVFNSLSSILVSVKKDGEVTQWNSAAEKIFGIPREQAVGKKVGELIPFLEKYEKQIESAVDHRREIQFFREIYQNGEKKYMDLSLFPLIFNGSSGAVIRLDDVTEIERKDEQLRQIQRMDTVKILAGGLAHDFNNILAAVIGTVSLMKYSIASHSLDQETIDESLQTIEESANRAVDLVKNLLTLSRKQEVMFSNVDLNSIVSNLVKICKNSFDKSIVIETSLCGEEAIVRGDTTQIEEMGLNLCINGWHAMTIMRKPGEKAGGVLRVSVEKVTADKSFCEMHPLAHEGDYFVIVVGDNGVGIDRSDLQRIFDPFFTTKKQESGTGLGLSMSFMIMQTHNGFIDVYTESGKGTEFKAYFPSMSEPVEPQINVESIVNGSGLILLVDDEDAVRKMTMNILQECGYRVVPVDNGADAVKIYSARHAEIGLVILDMAMPGMSGLEVFIEMKKINPDVRALIESGFKQDKRINETLKLGALAMIQKPYTMVQLSRKVNELTNRHI